MPWSPPSDTYPDGVMRGPRVAPPSNQRGCAAEPAAAMKQGRRRGRQSSDVEPTRPDPRDRRPSLVRHPAGVGPWWPGHVDAVKKAAVDAVVAYEFRPGNEPSKATTRQPRRDKGAVTSVGLLSQARGWTGPKARRRTGGAQQAYGRGNLGRAHLAFAALSYAPDVDESAVDRDCLCRFRAVRSILRSVTSLRG